MDDIIVCDRCGKEFHPGHDKFGIPNGSGFELEDGRVIKMCCDCIVAFGIAHANGENVDSFFDFIE